MFNNSFLGHIYVAICHLYLGLSYSFPTMIFNVFLVSPARATFTAHLFPSMRPLEQCKSHGSAVGTATGYGLDDLKVGVPGPVRSRIFTCTCYKDQL
jgi:hypothetical protein